MSPLFVALPPADLPTVAYLPHALYSADALAASKTGTHTVRPGDTVYDIAATYGVSPNQIVRVNNLTSGGRWIMPGDRLVIPGKSADAAPRPAERTTTTTPATKSSTAPAKSSPTKSSTARTQSSGATYTVRSGDTLSGIALRHGTTVRALASASGINAGSFIYPGQRLVLPGGSGSTQTSAPTKAGGSTGNGTSRGGTAKDSPSKNSTPTGGSYTVRAGDTLGGIALRHGTTVNALAAANRINAGSFIYPGQKLVLPGSSSTKDSSSSSKDSTKDTGKGSSTSGTAKNAKRDRPWDESNIGSYKAGEYVQDTFLHYRYSNATARAAAANRDYLASVGVPSKAEMRKLIVETSRRHGVDSKLMLALSFQESSWNMAAVSPANAIGVMQVIPTSGQWASNLVGRRLNLLDPVDNVEAGVVIMKSLLASAGSRDYAIGAYYQGLGAVRAHGLFPDTRRYVANITYYMRTL